MERLGSRTLEVQPHTREIHEWLDTRLAKLAWITDTRALQNQWRAERSTTDNDLLSSLENLRPVLLRMKGLGRDSLDTHSTIALQNHLVDLGVAHQMKILVVGTCTMDVGMGRIGATSSVAIDPLHLGQRVVFHLQLIEYRTLSQCSAPCPVTRSWRSSVVGIP
jgi:hypothetical protein